LFLRREKIREMLLERCQWRRRKIFIVFAFKGIMGI